MQRDEQRGAPATPEHPEHLTRRMRELQQENEALHTRVHRLSTERQRLETRFPGEARFQVKSAPGEGFSVTLSLPAEELVGA